MDSDEEEMKRYERELFGDDDETNAVSDQEGKSTGSGKLETDDDDRGSIKSEEGGDNDLPSIQTPEAQEDKKKVKPKKPGPVRRYLLKEDVLCGKNGLIKIAEIFKDFKFEGKGREQRDLDRVLYKLEHWVHLMHPRYTFGQTLERIEFLGMKKKSVKTYIKKIRMGLISSTDKDDNLLDLADDISGDDEVPLEHESTDIHATTSSSHHTIPLPADEIPSDDDFPLFDDEELDIPMEKYVAAHNDPRPMSMSSSSPSPEPVASTSRVEVEDTNDNNVDSDSD